jgi:endonuclease/exonuclease/phosphatase (EEP) superfamily protein YafD
VSANLWNGRADAQAFAEQIAQLDPDVVAVQELSNRQAHALRQAIPHGVLEPDDDFFGMGIGLRYPAHVWRLPSVYRDPRLTEIAVSAPDGAVDHVEIINVHVQAPHSPPLGSGWLNRRGQLRELERYLDAHPGRRRIIVGDFNSTPIWPWYRRLRDRFVDAAVAAAERNTHRPQPTWGPWPGSPRVLRIDHARVSGLVVDNFQVVPIRGGDHSALVVDLSLE